MRNKLFLLFVFCAGYVSAQPLSDNIVIDKIIAKVNDEIILMSDLDVAYLQTIQAGYEDYEKDLKCAVFESLVINKMLVAKAAIDSVIVEDAVVEDELNRRMAYFISQVGGSEQLLEQYYEKSIEEIKTDIRSQLKDQMTSQKMQENITSSAKVSPGDVRKFFNSIPKDSLPYYSTEVEIGHIVRYHEVSKNQKSKSKNELLKLKERINNGEDFGTLAKEFSQDPGSKMSGGELGFFKKGELVPEYEAAALLLKPGEMSDVVESQFGFHLIQLIEKRGSEYNTRHILIKPQSSDLDESETKRFLDSLRTEITNKNISFEKAAKQYSADRFTTSTGGMIYDPETNSTKLSLEQIDPNVFFLIDTMQVGEISKPIPYKAPDGKIGMRIIFYKSTVPPHQANLKDDYQKISTAALNNKRSSKLDEWFEQNKNSLYINIDKEYSHCKILE